MIRASSLLLGGSILFAQQQPADSNENLTGSVHRLESNVHVRAARIHFEAGAARSGTLTNAARSCFAKRE